MITPPLMLIKASMPDWEKRFDSVQEAAEELRRHVCGGCRDEIADSHSLDDLLSTSCGCEFWIEELEA